MSYIVKKVEQNCPDDEKTPNTKTINPAGSFPEKQEETSETELNSTGIGQLVLRKHQNIKETTKIKSVPIKPRNPTQPYSPDNISVKTQCSSSTDTDEEEDEKDEIVNKAKDNHPMSSSSSSPDIYNENNDSKNVNINNCSSSTSMDVGGKSDGNKLSDGLLGWLFGSRPGTRCRRRRRKPRCRKLKGSTVKAAAIKRRRKKKTCPANRGKRGACCPAKGRPRRKCRLD